MLLAQDMVTAVLVQLEGQGGFQSQVKGKLLTSARPTALKVTSVQHADEPASKLRGIDHPFSNRDTIVSALRGHEEQTKVLSATTRGQEWKLLTADRGTPRFTPR